MNANGGDNGMVSGSPVDVPDDRTADPETVVGVQASATQAEREVVDVKPVPAADVAVKPCPACVARGYIHPHCAMCAGDSVELPEPVASPAESRDSGGWQPIETAPKTGMRLLLGFANEGDTCEGRWCFGPGGGRWQVFCDTERREDQPTHWMELPNSPSTLAPPAPAPAPAAEVTLAELAAKSPPKPMTPERVREICGDPCGSVVMSPDRAVMEKQFMDKVAAKAPAAETVVIEPTEIEVMRRLLQLAVAENDRLRQVIGTVQQSVKNIVVLSQPSTP